MSDGLNDFNLRVVQRQLKEYGIKEIEEISATSDKTIWYGKIKYAEEGLLLVFELKIMSSPTIKVESFKKMLLEEYSLERDNRKRDIFLNTKKNSITPEYLRKVIFEKIYMLLNKEELNDGKLKEVYEHYTDKKISSLLKTKSPKEIYEEIIFKIK